MREQQKYIVCCHTSVQTGWITMKKLLATVLVLSIVVGLIGCSAASAPTVQPAPTEQTSAPASVPAQTETPAPTAQPGEQNNYAQLNSFIELINSFSDAPELDSDAEYDVYYKDLFDQWRAGEAFPFIIEDASGALVIDDHSPEFTGGWQDSTSQRATMDITSDRGIYYNIEINWGSSAMENTVWHFTGTYDSKRNGIVYSSGQRIEETYLEEGEEPKTEIVYEDGSGLISLKDGKLYWQDDKEDVGAECVFEKIG